MPRALTTHGLHVVSAEREALLETLRERRRAVKSSGCNYWVFEDAATKGVMLEFVEGPDTESLAAARHAAGLGSASDAVFIEVEL